MTISSRRRRFPFASPCGWTRAVLFVAAGMLAGAPLGCAPPSEQAEVRGKIIMGGNPLDGVRIGFVALPPADPSTSGGTVTVADGSFEIYLNPGRYKVTFSRLVDQQGKVPGESADPTQDYTQLAESGLLRETLPKAYTQLDTTPLEVEIRRGEQKLGTIELERSPN